MKEEINNKIKEPVILSVCCNSEIDYQGGGYIGENIAPVFTVCEKCGETCDTKRIIPKGWIDEELPF